MKVSKSLFFIFFLFLFFFWLYEALVTFDLISFLQGLEEDDYIEVASAFVWDSELPMVFNGDAYRKYPDPCFKEITEYFWEGDWRGTEIVHPFMGDMPIATLMDLDFYTSLNDIGKSMELALYDEEEYEEVFDFIWDDYMGYMHMLNDYLEVNGELIRNPVYTSYHYKLQEYKPVEEFTPQVLAEVELAYLDMLSYLQNNLYYDEDVIQPTRSYDRIMKTCYNIFEVDSFKNSLFDDEIAMMNSFGRRGVGYKSNKYFNFEDDDEFMFTGMFFEVCTEDYVLEKLLHYGPRRLDVLALQNCWYFGIATEEMLGSPIDDYVLNRLAIYDDIGLNNKIVKLYGYFFDVHYSESRYAQQMESDFEVRCWKDMTFSDKALVFLSKFKYMAFGIFLLLVFVVGG